MFWSKLSSLHSFPFVINLRVLEIVWYIGNRLILSLTTDLNCLQTLHWLPVAIQFQCWSFPILVHLEMPENNNKCVNKICLCETLVPWSYSPSVYFVFFRYSLQLKFLPCREPEVLLTRIRPHCNRGELGENCRICKQQRCFLSVSINWATSAQCGRLQSAYHNTSYASRTVAITSSLRNKLICIFK